MSNKAKAFNTLNTFADSRVKLIQGMKDAGYATVEECRPIVIEWACLKTGAEYRETKAGKIVLVSDHPKYEGAKTTVRDMAAITAFGSEAVKGSLETFTT